MMFPVRFAASLYVGSFQDVETLAATNPLMLDTEIPGQPAVGDLFHFEDEECKVYEATHVYWSHPLQRYVVQIDFSGAGRKSADDAQQAGEEEGDLDPAQLEPHRAANLERADQLEASLVGAGFKIDESCLA